MRLHRRTERLVLAVGAVNASRDADAVHGVLDLEHVALVKGETHAADVNGVGVHDLESKAFDEDCVYRILFLLIFIYFLCWFLIDEFVKALF